MVWATILAATVIGQRSLWTADAPYRSRAEFHALAAPFKHGSRIEDVIRALGKPDRIQKRHGVLVSEVLDYGIEPMSKVATLGTFVFEEGKLTYDHSGPITSDYFDRTKPYVQIIPEAELRQILGQICEEPPQWLLNDALRILHLTNILAALGDAKAKYALGESERLHPHIISFQYPDLLQTLFADPNVAQDLPIVLHWSLAEFLIGGKPTTLHSYRAKSIRTDLIHPPTDPFSVLWNELRKNKIPMDQFGDYYMDALLRLVRTVIQPLDIRVSGCGSSRNFEKYHQLFLKESPVWDEKAQSYRRGDGKILPDWPKAEA